MENENKPVINISAEVNAPIEKIWKYWNTPEDVVKWNTASPEWHTPVAENDLKKGGKFNYRMEAKDGSFGFDFWGIYDEISPNKHIAYTLGDERKVSIDFITEGDKTIIKQSFEAESQNPVEMQQAGWQSILDNFKKFAESN